MGGGVSVGVVSPETTELELVLGEVEVREAVPMVPGMEPERLEDDENFLGLANLCSSGGRVGVIYTCIIIWCMIHFSSGVGGVNLL